MPSNSQVPFFLQALHPIVCCRKSRRGLVFGSGRVVWYIDRRINTSPEKLGLSFGLSFQAVRSLLAGWKDHPARATQSEDRSRYYAVWDFTPPEGSDAPPLRLTFENEKLIL